MQLTVIQQTIRLVFLPGVVHVKQVRGAEKNFYDEVKQHVKNVLDLRMEEMGCQGQKGLIWYIDSRLDWRGDI